MKIILILLIYLNIFSITLQAVECNAILFEKIEKNDRLTSLQKEHKVKTLCYGKTVIVEGRVTEISSSTISLEDIKNKTKYTCSLLHSESCGNLLKINKGDTLKIRGEISSIWINIAWVNLEYAECIK